MSVETIKDQIFKFLSSDTPEVMAIKGEWGVGKTFSWNKFLKEARDAKNIKLDRYSYVSLFGINSLKELKYLIFQNVIKNEIIGTDANIETFKDNSFELMESLGRKAAGFFSRTTIMKSFVTDIEAISFLSLNKTIICIDDLERKGKGLEIKDVLGLVSLLKEQKNCKVVLLLNDGEEGLEDYQKYREKVIDIELAFAPTPKECTSIAYSDDAFYQNKLQDFVVILGIRNIRILKKIERLVARPLLLLKDFEPEVSEQIIHSIVLYSWSYYCSNSNEDIPPLDFIIGNSYALLGVGGETVSKQQETWKSILHSYKCGYADELDLLLAEYIKNGYFVESELISKVSARNQEIIASKSENSFSEAWRLYHESFVDNTDEVISGLYESLKKNCKYITPANLNSTVSLFRDLDENGKASEVIDMYIESRASETELFNIGENDFFGDVNDIELVEKFNIKYKQFLTEETAIQVLYRISGTNGWDKKAEVVLANTTATEYYAIFKSEKGEKLSSIVRTCLQFGQSNNANDKQKKITNIATEALIKIASEGKVNRRRVKGFGVDLPD